MGEWLSWRRYNAFDLLWIIAGTVLTERRHFIIGILIVFSGWLICRILEDEIL